MSTYHVDISLAPAGSAPTHTWAIDSGDPADETATSQVLDGLVLSWAQPENEPFPAQPDPATLRLSLLLDDATELSDIGVLDVANVEISSGGTVLAQLSGQIGQLTAAQVRRRDPATGNIVLKTRFDILVVEFLAELADVKVTATFASESINARQANVLHAIEAARGRPFTSWNLGGDGVNAAILEAVTYTNASALDVLNDLMADWADVGAITDRLVLYALVNDDTGDWSPAARELRPASGAPSYSASYPPGVLQVTAHQLDLAFDGATPAPAGLAIDVGQVELDSVGWVALKYATIARVTLTGPTLGALSIGNGQIGAEYARQTKLTTAADALVLARWLLPPADETRWTLDTFKWHPTDAELAAMDYPIGPQSNVSSVTSYMIERAPVALINIPDGIQPAGPSPFYGGTLSALTLTITGGNVIVSGKIARRIITHPSRSVTIADVAANFPTVKLKTGTDVVAPTLSIYEAKLARKM
jgi:hypothetical protein